VLGPSYVANYAHFLSFQQTLSWPVLTLVSYVKYPNPMHLSESSSPCHFGTSHHLSEHSVTPHSPSSCSTTSRSQFKQCLWNQSPPFRTPWSFTFRIVYTAFRHLRVMSLRLSFTVMTPQCHRTETLDQKAGISLVSRFVLGEDMASIIHVISLVTTSCQRIPGQYTASQVLTKPTPRASAAQMQQCNYSNKIDVVKAQS